MLNRAYVLSTLLGAAAFSFATSAAMAEPAKITVWSWDIAADALERAATTYMAAHPDVKIEVSDFAGTQIYDQVTAACSAGGEGMPDVFTLENSQAAIFFAQFPGCFADLSAKGVDSIHDQYPAFTWSDLQFDGKTYGIPSDTGAAAIFYNRKIFADAGIDATAIKTWDDYIAAGQTLLKATDGKVKMSMSGHASNDDWFWMLSAQNGCSYFDLTKDEITVNQPGCVEAIDTIKRINDAGILASGGWDDKLQALKAGSVASMLYGAWYVGSIEDAMPDQTGNWGAMLMPAFHDGGSRASYYGGSAIVSSAKSAQSDLAYDFMLYATGDESQEDMLKHGLVPAKLSVITGATAGATSEYWGGQAVWKDILSTMDQVPTIRGTRWLADATQAMVEVQNRYLSGEIASGQEAMDEVAGLISSASGLPIAAK